MFGTTYYYTDVHIYIYDIKYIFVVPYRVQRVQYCVYDFVAHRWEVHRQCTSWRTQLAENLGG
jgi:hypothetical protein